MAPQHITTHHAMNLVRIISKSIWALAIGSLWLSPLVAEEYMTENQALKLAFPKADEFDLHRMIATKTQRDDLAERLGVRLPSRFFKYYRCKQGGKLIGRAIVDEAPGKYHPFGYLLAVDPAHKVRSVEILNYHEKYGFEVKQDSFKDQFKGHSPTDSKHLERDIRIIAGATISCQSLIESIKRQLIYLEVMTEAKDTKQSGLMPTPSGNLPGPIRETTSEEKMVHRNRGRLLMGTFLEIQAFGPSEASMDHAMNLAFEEVVRIEQLLSTYRPDSIISKLNQHGAEKPVSLNREVFDLLERSKEITSQTKGAFDITVGPIVQLWRHAKEGIPDVTAIEQSTKNVGMHHVQLDEKSLTAWFDTKGVQVDLGGIGKGYAMDRAAEILKQQGIQRAMLSFGGHILALDPPPGKSGWNIWIRDPDQEDAFIHEMDIQNASVATTANDQRGYWINGKRYSHIIHPATGLPVEGKASVTVITKKAEEGDALSTALFASKEGHMENLHFPTALSLGSGSILYSQFH